MSSEEQAQQPKIIIIAGPNGAGKTTFAREFLPHEAHCPTFINADLIAAGLAPFEPETAAIQAGRIMLEMVEHSVQQRKSFAIETTLSGKTYTQKILHWQALGYHVKLIFLQLPSEESAIKRVANRVAHGGHDIPEHVIRRGFCTGIKNFHERYKPLVDVWLHFDSADTTPQLIDWSEK